MNYFDDYKDKSIVQRVLTDKPRYFSIEGSISNNESNDLVYHLDLKEDTRKLFLVIKLDSDDCGNCTHWIELFDLEYDKYDYYNADCIVNTNYWNSDDSYDNDHVVFLKID